MFDHRHLAAAAGVGVQRAGGADRSGVGSAARSRAVRAVGSPARSDPRARILDALIGRSPTAAMTAPRSSACCSGGCPGAVFDEHFEDKEDCFLQALDES